MRIASGDTTKYIYFVAVDDTDFATRETGLSSFTVYRSRDGGAAAAMTTPTINEVDASNMPGVYELLVDEDTTIGAGHDTEEMVFHITATGMAPVTRTVEIYRPKFTEGSTLTLAGINAECDTAISDASLATSAALATVDANVDAILTDTGTTLPAQITGLNDLSAADVRTAVGLASANLDTQLSTIDTNVDAVLVDTGTTIPATLSTLDGKVDTLDGNVDSILVDTDTTIPGLIAGLNDLDAAGVRTAIGLSSANLDTQLDGIPTALENADALLNRDMSAVSDTNGRSPLNALRFLRNKWSVAGTTLTVTKEDDTTSAWTATLTADASANPVVVSDPA